MEAQNSLPLEINFLILNFISCSYISEQNEHTERKHRHIIKLSLATMYVLSIYSNPYYYRLFTSTVHTRLSQDKIPSTSPHCVSSLGSGILKIFTSLMAFTNFGTIESTEKVIYHMCVAEIVQIPKVFSKNKKTTV
jgi:hypothetical protein